MSPGTGPAGGPGVDSPKQARVGSPVAQMIGAASGATEEKVDPSGTRPCVTGGAMACSDP